MIARVRLRPDRREEAEALLKEVEAASRLDEGCIAYGYYEGLSDGEDCVAVEHWADMASLEAHLTQPHVGKLIAALGGLVSAPPQIVAHTISSSGPLPLP